MSILDQIVRDPRWVLRQIAADYYASGGGNPPRLFCDRLLNTIEDLPELTTDRIARQLAVPDKTIRTWLDHARCRRGG